jgi:microcystin degradation protein MlrC
METMQAAQTEAATFAPLVNKRGSLEQLWAHLFKAPETDRLQTPVVAATAAAKS